MKKIKAKNLKIGMIIKWVLSTTIYKEIDRIDKITAKNGNIRYLLYFVGSGASSFRENTLVTVADADKVRVSR